MIKGDENEIAQDKKYITYRDTKQNSEGVLSTGISHNPSIGFDIKKHNAIDPHENQSVSTHFLEIYMFKNKVVSNKIGKN